MINDLNTEKTYREVKAVKQGIKKMDDDLQPFVNWLNSEYGIDLLYIIKSYGKDENSIELTLVVDNLSQIRAIAPHHLKWTIENNKKDEVLFNWIATKFLEIADQQVKPNEGDQLSILNDSVKSKWHNKPLEFRLDNFQYYAINHALYRFVESPAYRLFKQKDFTRNIHEFIFYTDGTFAIYFQTEDQVIESKKGTIRTDIIEAIKLEINNFDEFSYIEHPSVNFTFSSSEQLNFELERSESLKYR